MFIAQMDSESRTWLAIGYTEQEAKEALREAWNENQRRLVQGGWKNSPDYYGNARDLDNNYGVTVTELNVGECKSW